MEPDARRVIVTEGSTAGTSQVQHQDFPEIRAQGETPTIAAAHLSNQLTRALDTALTTWRRDAIQQAMADLENINAHLFSIEVLMERIFDVRVPEQVEQAFREVAGELAPDPLNADRLRLNRLLHQTPDLPDHRP